MTSPVVVAGGGTAGHVLPALAVADALVAAGHDPASIHYVGARRGVETRLLVDTPYDATFLDVVGAQRRITRENLGFVPKMWTATREMIARLREWSPGAVVSVGGYASMPAVFAARRLGIPIVVVSYDRTPGRASQLSARWASACAVAFDASPLPNAELTGAPVRQTILDVDRGPAARAAARRQLGIDEERFLVTVMGGSLGSGVLNARIAEYVADHRQDGGLAVRQIAGERFVDDIEAVDGGAVGVRHQVLGYEPDMATVYAASDVLVGRGGASTVHEVAVTGVPAILVPWSGAADDHQTQNVRWLSEVGGAVELAEGELDRLPAEIERLRHDDAARAELAAAARRRGDVHRSGALARLIERVAVTSSAS